MKEYVIITGAYGGLGRALAHTYADAGYGLVLVGRKQDKLEALKQELNEKTNVIALVVDVSRWEECKTAETEIRKKKLLIKVLINNAGVTYIKNFDNNYKISRFNKVIETNLNGPVYMTNLFLKDIVDNQGTLINISSVLGYAPVIGRTAYAASKFGLEGFSSVLKAEYGHDLHLLMVYPTFIATPIRDKFSGDRTVNEILSADIVAEKIIEAQNEKREYLYLGKTAKLSYLIYKFYPKLYVNLMRKKVGNLS